MFKVTETVFEDDKVVHQSEQDWKLKSKFINDFKKIPGISSHVACDLAKNNRVEFEAGGLKRIIEIKPQIELGAAAND